jgi:hypothetical protein
MLKSKNDQKPPAPLHPSLRATTRTHAGNLAQPVLELVYYRVREGTAIQSPQSKHAQQWVTLVNADMREIN